ncbi:MAG: hypothetical protein WDO24_30865 [Pseudomonadota bacterium]
MKLPPVLAALGEAAVIDHGGLGAARRQKLEIFQDARIGQAEGDDVGGFGQRLEARIAGIAEQLGIARIDRIDRAREAEPAGRLDDRAAEAGALRGAQHGDRTRRDQRLKIHERASGGKTAV